LSPPPTWHCFYIQSLNYLVGSLDGLFYVDDIFGAAGMSTGWGLRERGGVVGESWEGPPSK